MYACIVLCLVTQSCLTHCDPMFCSPPGSSVHGDSQARILGLVVIYLLGGLHLLAHEILRKIKVINLPLLLSLSWSPDWIARQTDVGIFAPRCGHPSLFRQTQISLVAYS